MDLVVNHSSDEHAWFKSARASRTSPYRDYYYWWPAEKGTPPARYSTFDVKHDAWQYDAPTKSYYLHYFSKKQPDLNWNNPKLRQEVHNIMRYWLNNGIRNQGRTRMHPRFLRDSCSNRSRRLLQRSCRHVLEEQSGARAMGSN
jgi:hypothetical protein